ncbi:MAG: hypothetical protein V3T05_14580 [Myxococcota bacterium]
MSVLCLLLLAGWPVESAAARKAAKKSRVAIFPTVGAGFATQALVGAFDAELVRAAAATKGVRILSGKALRRKLNSDPAKAAKKCGSNTACLARLGKRAGVAEVVTGRAGQREGGGITVELVVITVRGVAHHRNATIEVASKAELGKAVGDQVQALLGVAPPDSTPDLSALPLAALPGEGGPEAPTPELEPEPEPEPGLGPELVSLTPIGSADDDAPLLDHPTDRVDVPIPLLPIDPMRLPNETAATSPTTTTLTPDAPPWLRWTAYGAGGVGVVALGAGTFFGLRAQTYDPPRPSDGMTLVAVLKQQKAQNRAATRGTALLISGGVIAALAAAAMVVERVVFSGPGAAGETEGAMVEAGGTR